MQEIATVVGIFKLKPTQLAGQRHDLLSCCPVKLSCMKQISSTTENIGFQWSMFSVVLDISLLQFPARLTLLSDLHRRIPACRDPAEILKQDQGLHLPAPVPLTFIFRHSCKT